MAIYELLFISHRRVARLAMKQHFHQPGTALPLIRRSLASISTATRSANNSGSTSTTTSFPAPPSASCRMSVTKAWKRMSGPSSICRLTRGLSRGEHPLAHRRRTRLADRGHAQSRCRHRPRSAGFRRSNNGEPPLTIARSAAAYYAVDRLLRRARHGARWRRRRWCFHLLGQPAPKGDGDRRVNGQRVIN